MKKFLLFAMALIVTSLMAGEGENLYKKCAACHGMNGEKKALNKSQVIAGWSEDKLITAIKGYKDGSYGGAMKGIMKGQVNSLNDAQIEKVAKHIATLK